MNLTARLSHVFFSLKKLVEYKTTSIFKVDLLAISPRNHLFHSDYSHQIFGTH